MLGWIKNNWPWFIIIAALVLMHSQHQLDSDEGVLLNAAWNIYNKRILYIDSFEFIAPLAPYLLSWWWKISEASFLSAWALALIMNFLSALALFQISQQLKIKTWKFLAPSIFVLLSGFWPIINHNAFNLTALLWGLYFLIKKDNNQFNFFIAGINFGLSIMFLQHKGLAALFGASLWLGYLIKNKKIKIKNLYLFYGGVIIPLFWFLRWPIKLLFNNLIIFPFKNYTETNYLSLMLFFIALAIGVIVSVISLLSKSQTNQSKKLIIIIGLCLLMSSLPRADATHIFQSITPFLALLGLVFEQCFTKRYDLYWVMAALFISTYLLSPKPFFENQIIQKIKTEIKKSCPTNLIYAGPFMPGLYFEMRTLSPVPFSMLITKQQTEQQFEQSLNILKNSPPECVILNYSTVEKFNYSQNNPLDKFLVSYYRNQKRLGNLYLMKR